MSFFITQEMNEYLQRGSINLTDESASGTKPDKESEKPSKIAVVIKVLVGSIFLSLVASIITGIFVFALYEEGEIANPFAFFFFFLILTYGILLLLFYVYYSMVHGSDFSTLISFKDFSNKSALGKGFALGMLFPLLGMLIASALGGFKFVEVKFTGELVLFALLAFVGYFLSSTVEEILFRAYYLKEFGKISQFPVGVFLNCVLFALVHLFTGAPFNFLWMLNLTLFGLVANLLIAKDGQIAGASSYHFGWNWSQTVLLGSINSSVLLGVGYGFVNFTSTGSDLLTGGIFGVEANIVITILLLVVSGLLVVRNQKSKEN